MLRRTVPLWLVLLAGCVNQQDRNLLVPNSPLEAKVPPLPPPGPVVQASYSAASEEAGRRVWDVGLKLLNANPQLGVRPQFLTIGSPQQEIFHRGTTDIVITEGLVRACQTEGQLAAVLATELGKMVADRELSAGPKARMPEREPPMAVSVGNDAGMGGPDLTRLAELAKYEKSGRRPPGANLPPPDPQVIARTVLTRSGYSVSELEAAAPLLRQAEPGGPFERQFNGGTPLRPWLPE